MSHSSHPGAIPGLVIAFSGDRHRTTLNVMAVRKAIAAQLANAAKALENDKSKENIGKAVFTARVVLANAIMPKQFNMPTKR